MNEEWIDVVFDFESEAIDVMPNYPPKPVGLALEIDGKPTGEEYYLAWGHPVENNCQELDVIGAVASLMANPKTWWTAHNLAFDAAIIEVKWGLKFPWDRCTDTMLLAFMDNPYGQLSLKPLCELEPLQMPPVERDAVREWLIRHGIVSPQDKQWGAHISKAPGKLVGTYAKGDVVRTRLLRNYYKALV